MDLNLVKDNIDYEQSLGEKSQDIVIKEEYVVPDTLPDVTEILMLDATPLVTSREVMNGKVVVEGQIQFNVLYMAREDENTEAHAITYNTKFNTNLDAPDATGDMICEAKADMEHIHCIIVNERKICIQGVMNVECEVIKKNSFEIVKHVDSNNDIQFLKNPMVVDKVVGQFQGEIIGRTDFKIDMDKPEIGRIVKCFITLGKKDIRLYDGGIHIEAVANVQVLYKAKNARELICVSENVLLTKELDVEKISQRMEHNTDFLIHPIECEVKEDDMGENRILEVEFLVKATTNVMCKDEVEMIEDAYSPSQIIRMEKQDFDMNVVQGNVGNETLVKGDIELDNEMPRPNRIIMATGTVNITDKKIMEDKVALDGVLKVDVLYSTSDEKDYVASVSDEIPFTTSTDVNGAKIDMNAICKMCLEMLEASIEAGNICVRAIVRSYCKVLYTVKKKFLIEMMPIEGEMPKKKASITIYVVQPGDTLWQIAKKYCTTKEEIMRVNELQEENDIKPMDKLIIPGRAVM